MLNTPVSPLHKFFVVIGIALIILGLGGYFWWARVVHPPAPDITFTLTDGHRLALQQLRGRPVLVNFWSVSCTTCIAEMPELNALYTQFASAGLEMIGVAMPFDRPELVLDIQKQQRINYKIAFDIPGDAVRAFWNVVTTPESFLINPQGQIVMHKKGKLDMLPLRLQIQTLLQRQEN